MPLPATPTPVTYDPAPFWGRWLETMPGWILVSGLVVAGVLWLLKKPIEEFVGKLGEQLVDRMKRSSKEPASGADLMRKAQKAIVLEQAAERLRIEIDCDHVSVYGIQNGEYLRSGEGIDKFVMQAEASRPGDPRYIDVERIVFANDIPRTVLALETQPYLLLWRGRCDDWKVDKMMTQRDYTSSIAVFLRRPLKPDSQETGIIGMYVVSWRDCELYRHDQASTLPASHRGEKRLIDDELKAQLSGYAATLSYTM